MDRKAAEERQRGTGAASEAAPKEAVASGTVRGGRAMDASFRGRKDGRHRHTGKGAIWLYLALEPLSGSLPYAGGA